MNDVDNVTLAPYIVAAMSSTTETCYINGKPLYRLGKLTQLTNQN